MRHGSPRSSRRARTSFAAIASVLCACAGPDSGPSATQLAVSSDDDPGANPRCMIPLGTWRVRYHVSDPGTSCALLLRDELYDFDAPDGHAAQPDVRCESRLEGPDSACRVHELRRCVRTLGGARYDSVVRRSFLVVGEQRLEGRGVAGGGSAVLGVCQTTFTLEATPE